MDGAAIGSRLASPTAVFAQLTVTNMIGLATDDQNRGLYGG